MLESWPAVARSMGAIVAFASTFVEKKRQRVADYLDAVAANLHGMADAAEQGRRFGTHCVKLRTTSHKLYDVCQSVTAAQDLRALAEQLNLAGVSPGALSRQDRLMALSGADKERMVESLREAAALFEEHAAVLRAR